MRIRQKSFQAVSFLNYWLKAVNEHSLHPPFVYSLYTKVVKSKETDPPVFIQIEQFRQELLKSRQNINIRELGAGSGITKNTQRSISHIARHSLTGRRFSSFLFKLIRFMDARTILELGTSLGINTLYLSAAAPEGQVYTLEGCPQTAATSRQLFTRWPQHNIRLTEGSIDDTLPRLLKSSLKKLDGAYLDANHTYAATLQYFELLLPCLHEDSFVVVDDIYWSAGMKKAWEEIKEHPKVRLSLDMYDAGILFFKPGLLKEHYVVEF